MVEPKTDAAPTALVYCRVSTRGLAEGTSLDSQRDACVAHACSLGYSVARVTREVHTGAELFSRPLLSRDRADLRAGKFKALIAYSVDRLTRDPAHLAVLSDECSRSGCRLLFVTRDEETDDPAEEAHAASVERRMIAERVRRGRRAKLLAGRPVFTGWDLYGYRADRVAGVYRVHEPEAEVVRRVFSMCAAGRGTFSIASAFNREGIPSPKAALRPGAKWSSSAVHDMLKDRSYTGEEVCRIAPAESGLVRLPDGVRPVIITTELWGQCQQRIRERAARMNNKWGHPALLRGHIFCAECGRGMIRQYFRRGQYEYLKYRCGSRWRPYETECRGEGVPLKAVHEWAWGRVKALLSSPGYMEQAVSNVERDGEASPLLADLQAVRRVREGCGRDALSHREVRRLGKLVAELEARLTEARLSGESLRQLRDICGGTRGDLELFTFEERRLAFRALSIRVCANGADPDGWRYEVGVSAERHKPAESSTGMAVA